MPGDDDQPTPPEGALDPLAEWSRVVVKFRDKFLDGTDWAFPYVDGIETELVKEGRLDPADLEPLLRLIGQDVVRGVNNVLADPEAARGALEQGGGDVAEDVQDGLAGLAAGLAGGLREFGQNVGGGVQDAIKDPAALGAQAQADLAAMFLRLFTAVPHSEIGELVKKAQGNDPSYSPPNFLTYFYLPCPPGVSPEEVAEVCRKWKIVETAYYDPPGGNAGAALELDRDLGLQGYLKAAPEGVNALFAWEHRGDGTGLKLVDIEEGWTLNHEDLPTGDRAPRHVHGVLRKDARDHGTAVLGIVAAQRDNIGHCVGIAYNLRALDLVSHAELLANGPQYTSNRPNAILTALPLLEFGDVLLLEVQLMPGQDGSYNFMPIELLPADFDTIRLATALGIVVVEAAGNGGRNLDPYPTLNRDHASFRDSGAIMVAAATSANPHEPVESTNYGSRIDCYAWGQNVHTTRSNKPGAKYMEFDGTSSAAAIIAGVALVVQGLAQANYNRRFSPRQLRAVLSDVENGTPSANGLDRDKIGSMPDLEKIIRNVLRLPPPDVYLSDSVTDTGDPGEVIEPPESPDIIVSRSLVADPSHEAASGGRTNYAYVRVRNRGPAAVEDVEVRLYWADRAQLHLPHKWKPITSRPLPRVVAGDTPVLSEGFAWTAPSVAHETDYDLIAMLGNADDPLPGALFDSEEGFRTEEYFWRFVRANNNVAWRPIRVQ